MLVEIAMQISIQIVIELNQGLDRYTSAMKHRRGLSFRVRVLRRQFVSFNAFILSGNKSIFIAARDRFVLSVPHCMSPLPLPLAPLSQLQQPPLSFPSLTQLCLDSTTLAPTAIIQGLRSLLTLDSCGGMEKCHFTAIPAHSTVFCFDNFFFTIT